MFNSKAHIKTATEHYGTFDLSCDHYTTSDLFKNAPIYITEMVPKSSIKVDTSLMCRLMPLYKPMYSSCKFTLRAFFVPMRVIFPRFNEYITDTTTDQSTILGSVPKFQNDTLVGCLAYNSEFTYSVTDDTYDFIVDGTKRKFTIMGRQIYSILLSLGYGINFTSTDKTKMSALPLFAYCKIYQDWILTSQYRNTEVNTLIKKYESGNLTMVSADLKSLFKTIGKCYYAKDYFTQAWDRPIAPGYNGDSQLGYSPITLQDHTTNDYSSSVVSTTDIIADENSKGTPYIISHQNQEGTLSPRHMLSQFALDALKDLTDYMKRHQLSGYRPLDRFLARWGVKLESEKLYRSVYCGKYDCPVQIADIMATTEGDNQQLGEYAGRGIASFSNKSFEYKTDEFGYFVILNEITSRTPIVQGRKKFIFHGTENRLQFYTPEFDNLSAAAIRKDEVLTGVSVSTSGGSMNYVPERIFGFQPTYSEYKTSTGDFMSGNFRIKSLANGLDTFHTCRMFSETSDPLHNETFIEAAYDGYQFDRIFQVSGCDHFINIFHFDVTMRAPMSELYDNYHFEEDGKPVSMNVNGTQLV